MLPGVEATAVVAAFNLERVHWINRGGVEPPEGWYHVGLCRLADFFSNHNYKKVKDLAEIIVRIIL